MLITTVKSDLLSAALQKVLKVRQSNMNATLECVHCKAVKGGLILSCTNLDTTVTTGIPANTAEKKEFLIPFKVQTILLQLPAEVDIEVHNGDCLMFRYNDGVIKVPYEKPEDFPKPVQVEPNVSFRVEDHREFGRLLSLHKKFSSNDSLRPALTGVCFSNLNMSATDAHRLSFTDYADAYTDSDFSVLLSKIFIVAFAGIESSFKVTIDDSYIMVNDKNTGIVSRIVSAKDFPEVGSVIPDENNLQVEVKRLELLAN